MRPTNIRRTILDNLERVAPLANPEKQLRMEINGRLRPPVGTAEFDEEMLFLQSRGYIARVPDPLDDALVKWTITESGMAVLRH